jgi:CO/xanthine dehydrogenase Mo-binding subunit
VRVENVLRGLNAGCRHVPDLVSGQSQGGVAMAIGYTLMEDAKPGPDGPADGKWNLDQYHVPRFSDVPLGDQITAGARAQELIHVQPLLGEKAAGRGIAEAVMCSIPPAIANALFDAIGVRFRSLPITRDDIKKALG